MCKQMLGGLMLVAATLACVSVEARTSEHTGMVITTGEGPPTAQLCGANDIVLVYQDRCATVVLCNEQEMASLNVSPIVVAEPLWVEQPTSSLTRCASGRCCQGIVAPALKPSAYEPPVATLVASSDGALGDL